MMKTSLGKNIMPVILLDLFSSWVYIKFLYLWLLKNKLLSSANDIRKKYLKEICDIIHNYIKNKRGQKRHQHGISIQVFVNLRKTFFRVHLAYETLHWPDQFLARLFVHLSSFTFQIMDFLYWMVSIFIFYSVTVKTRQRICMLD